MGNERGKGGVMWVIKEGKGGYVGNERGKGGLCG